MKKPVFDKILNMDDSEFERKLTEAIDPTGEGVTIILPQFNRVDGRAVPVPDCDFTKMDQLPDETLKEIGCQVWDRDGKRTMWLYPAEWYDYFPDGLEVIDIFGNLEFFKRGVTDDDRRFGALSFGFTKDAE